MSEESEEQYQERLKRSIEHNKKYAEAAAKADIEYKKSIRPVKVVGLEIPCGDVMALTFKGFCASLIMAIPIVFIFLLTTLGSPF